MPGSLSLADDDLIPDFLVLGGMPMTEDIDNQGNECGTYLQNSGRSPKQHE